MIAPKFWIHQSFAHWFRAECHTIAVTPVALHSVAHTMSQQIPAILEMSQRCRSTSPIPTPKRPCRTYLATPLSLCHRGNLLAKTDRATRGCSSYTHTPIALHCATKVQRLDALGKFQSVTIQGTQPSPRLCKESCCSEGFLSTASAMGLFGGSTGGFPRGGPMLVLGVWGDTPKEQRSVPAEKRLSKRVFLESLFLLCPLKVCS